MKLLPAVLISFVADAKEKKVPPRHPRQRLRTLKRFALEWITDNLETNKLNKIVPDGRFEHYKQRFIRRADRFKWLSYVGENGEEDSINLESDDLEEEFKKKKIIPCFYYNSTTTHGGRSKRKRRDDTDYEYLDGDYDFGKSSDDLVRYDKSNALRGLKQIMTGFKKWALRYIDQCPAEKTKQTHSKWSNVMKGKLQATYKQFNVPDEEE